jgi:hypothetical protein
MRRSRLLFTLVAAAIAACRGPATPRDGGMDAASRDGARPNVRCTGTPTACALLDEASCGTVEGCVLGPRCSGAPLACDGLSEEAACTGQAGCSWDGAACTGTATACAGLPDRGDCIAQIGCEWSAREACRGTPIPCGARSADTCEAQPGCSLAHDAGVTSWLDGAPPRCELDAGRHPGCGAPAGPPAWPGCNPDIGVECDGDWTGTNPMTGLPYCHPECAPTECCSPRDGRFGCHPRDPDGSCPAADVFVDASRTEGSYVIDEQFFDEGDCAVVEGCVDGPGRRRLLRFDTWTPNVGTADLFLGDVPPLGTSSELYEWSACHRHHHFRSYAEYELLSADACCAIVKGRKQAFCLVDLRRHDPEVGSDTGTYDCGFQGLQRGWEDYYPASVDCQWIDITDVPPGNYLLRIRLNTEHVLLESNYDNNEVLLPIRIP